MQPAENTTSPAVPTAASTLPEWLAYIESMHPKGINGIEMGLDRVRSVAQRLESLMLTWQLYAPLVAMTWLLQLPASLRELGLLTCAQLHISASLGSLTQLSRDGTMAIEEGVSLPPSVCMLALCDTSEALPSQASWHVA